VLAVLAVLAVCTAVLNRCSNAITVDRHPLNGTKFFTWGMADFGTFQQDFMSASDYQNPECYKDMEVPHYDPHCEHYKHEGRYTGPSRRYARWRKLRPIVHG